MNTNRRMIALTTLALGLLFGVQTRSNADDPPAVIAGKKLIETNAESITLLSFNPISYTYIKNEYVGSRKLDDGTYVVNYKFHLKGSVFNRFATFDFYFDKNGQFEHVEGDKGTAIWKPWDVVSSYTDGCKTSLKSIPAVANDVKMLKQISDANQKQLCELALKNGLQLKR